MAIAASTKTYATYLGPETASGGTDGDILVAYNDVGPAATPHYSCLERAQPMR
jgi:hypothetical protein